MDHPLVDTITVCPHTGVNEDETYRLEVVDGTVTLSVTDVDHQTHHLESVTVDGPVDLRAWGTALRDLIERGGYPDLRDVKDIL